MKFNPKIDYYLEGQVLVDLFKVSERFNDGTKIEANERRDLAQRMQALLSKAMPVGMDTY